MYKLFSLFLLAVLLGSIIITPAALAQQTADERFEQVQLLSSEEKYTEAIQEIKQLISEYPQNLDYQIYLGRIYSWAGKYEESVQTLKPIVEAHPENEEALWVLLKTSLWACDVESTIKYADAGIKNFPEKESDYQMLKLEKYIMADSVKTGLALAESLRKNSPHSIRLKEAETTLLKKQKNQVVFSYTNTFFPANDFDPWHLGTISYIRDWEKIPVEFRLSYANLFNKYDVQIDADLYPKIGPQSYLFVNLGFAPNQALFPAYRAGVEYFHDFKTGYSFSAGGRLLKFTEEPIPILTAHAGKNIGEYNLQYRPLLVIKNQDTFPTHTLALRKNWPVEEAFLRLDLQYGTAPYFLFITDDFDRVSSKRIGFQSQFRVAKNLLMRLNLMYENEEFSPGNFRNRMNSQIIIFKRF